MSSRDGMVSLSVGPAAEGSQVRGSGATMLLCGEWFTRPEMKT